MEDEINAGNGLSQDQAAGAAVETVQSSEAAQADAGAVNTSETGTGTAGSADDARDDGANDAGPAQAPAVAESGDVAGENAAVDQANANGFGESLESFKAAEAANEAGAASLPNALDPGQLTDDERDHLEAKAQGVTVDELRAARELLKNTPQIQADPPVTDTQAGASSGGAGALEPAPLGAEVLGEDRYGQLALGRLGEAVGYKLGPLQDKPDHEVLLASRLTDKGWANVPVLIQHLDNGMSREVDIRDLERGPGGEA